MDANLSYLGVSGTAIFAEISLPLMTWSLASKAASAMKEQPKVTKPNPRDLPSSRFLITWQSTNCPNWEKCLRKSFSTCQETTTTVTWFFNLDLVTYRVKTESSQKQFSLFSHVAVHDLSLFLQGPQLIRHFIIFSSFLFLVCISMSHIVHEHLIFPRPLIGCFMLLCLPFGSGRTRVGRHFLSKISL